MGGMSLLQDSMAVGGQLAMGLGRGARGQRQWMNPGTGWKGHPRAEEKEGHLCVHLGY